MRIRRLNDPEPFRQKAKDWRINNLDKRKDLDRRYYAENKKQIRKKQNARYVENPEPQKEAARERRKANSDHVQRIQYRWRSLNQDRIRQYRKDWTEKNPDKAREANRGATRRRRARLRGAATELYVAVEIFERDKWKCQLCGRKVNKNIRHPAIMCASIDHIVPTVEGGADAPWNVQLAHLICNMRKHTKPCGSQLLLF